ncbi:MULTISPECIES: YncE family protein [unclassified Agrococcus]|uniref:YncE family protein n=1 Tax=unclassified Agrococcus TaxID=2615065 RepID=UPI00360AB64C
MPTRHRLARLASLAALAAAGSLLVACAPGSLAPAPSAAPTTSPSPSPSPPPSPTSAPERELLLATLAASNALAVVDPTATDPVVASIEVGAAPWGVAVDERAGRAFVATAEGLAVVDLATMARTALVPYRHQPAGVAFGEYRDGGLGVAVSPDGATAYVAVHRWPDPAWLEVFDVASGTFVASVDVGVRPFDVLVDPAGAWVATVDHDTYGVTVVDAATLAARTIEVAPFGDLGFASWEKPHYGVVTATGTILLPFQGQAMVEVDPIAGTSSIAPLAAQTHQHGVAQVGGEGADAGTTVVVGTGAFGSATRGPSLEVLRPDGTDQVVPLAQMHETATVWRADADDAWSAVLAGGSTRDGWWDGLTIVDLDTLAQREIPVAGRPQAVVAATLPG